MSDREDPFAAIIRCTADPAKADKRTRSKWSRAMRYAAVYKPDSEPLNQFVKRKGGVDECAARFTRRWGEAFHVDLARLVGSEDRFPPGNRPTPCPRPDDGRTGGYRSTSRLFRKPTSAV